MALQERSDKKLLQKNTDMLDKLSFTEISKRIKLMSNINLFKTRLELLGRTRQGKQAELERHGCKKCPNN
jgi:hypothetical protein